MAGSYSIMVGTTGAGLFHSPDSGESWSRIGSPIPGESQIRALAVDPQSPNVAYAGANNGIYRSDDAGKTWLKLDSPMDGLNIWSNRHRPRRFQHRFRGHQSSFHLPVPGRRQELGKTIGGHRPGMRHRQSTRHRHAGGPGGPGHGAGRSGD